MGSKETCLTVSDHKRMTETELREAEGRCVKNLRLIWTAGHRDLSEANMAELARSGRPVDATNDARIRAMLSKY